MQTNRSPRCLATLAVAACTCAALGGPPLITDDPGTEPDGKTSLTLSYQAEHARDTWVHDVPYAELQSGLTKTLELAIDQPFVLADEADGGLRGGIGSAEVSLKWRFAEQDTAGVDLSIAPRVILPNPARYFRHDVLDRGTDVFLPMQFGKSFGSVSVYGEVGYTFVQLGKDVVGGGLALDWQVVPEKFDLCCEIHDNVDCDFRHQSPVVQAGFTWTFAEEWTLLAAAGRSLRSGDQDDLFLGYVGLKYDF